MNYVPSVFIGLRTSWQVAGNGQIMAKSPVSYWSAILETGLLARSKGIINQNLCTIGEQKNLTCSTSIEFIHPVSLFHPHAENLDRYINLSDI